MRKLHPQGLVFCAGGSVSVMNRPAVAFESRNAGVSLFLIQITIKRLTLKHGEGETAATHMKRRLRALIDFENHVVQWGASPARQAYPTQYSTEDRSSVRRFQDKTPGAPNATACLMQVSAKAWAE